MSDTHVHLTRVAAARWRLALLLTAAMTLIYVGFILLIAFNKPLLGTILMPGLSLGILLGVLVILTAWALILIYVRWTNTHYDHRVADVRRARREAPLMQTGETNVVAMAGFAIFIGLSLVITWFAARRTRSTEHFYAAGPIDHRVAERPRARRRLHERGQLSRHRRPRGDCRASTGLIYSIGFLVGWPVVMCLIAEPLRNLGKFTFSDVVAFRLRQTPVRVAAAAGSLAVVAFYLIAQMVGAGNLIRLLFGLNYETAVVIVGVVMLAYVLFGGMIATTWVQIVKAVLLLTGAFMLAMLVLAKFSFNPLALFAEATRQYGAGVLAPGRFVSDPVDGISLGLALMFGTAGLPHILMRFYTVPDARTARVSVAYATAVIGAFYLLTFILGFGAMVLVGQTGDSRGRRRRQHGRAAAGAKSVGGQAFLGFISAVAFATILAVVAGLTLAGAAALSHDIYVHVFRGGQASEKEAARVARGATIVLALLSIVLGIAFKGQNVAYMVGLAFAIAASANFPALVLSMFWRGFTTRGAQASILVGTVVDARC